MDAPKRECKAPERYASAFFTRFTHGMRRNALGRNAMGIRRSALCRNVEGSITPLLRGCNEVFFRAEAITINCISNYLVNCAIRPDYPVFDISMSVDSTPVGSVSVGLYPFNGEIDARALVEKTGRRAADFACRACAARFKGRAQKAEIVG